MSFSINTNAGAFVALQNLSSTQNELGVVQNRINTGLAVSNAKDNSAVFAIAQNLRADVGGLNAVKQSIDRGTSTLDVARSAAESISDILIQLKEKAVAASDEGLDASSRSALASDFNALRDQIGIIVNNASFNGSNLIDGAGNGLKVLLSDDGSQSFSVAGQDLTLTSDSAVGITASTSFDTASEASALISTIESGLTSVNNVLGSFGSAQRTLETQSEFVSKLSDTIQTGIGNLVDADLARESARLQALQVKQQLGLQALSIANQAPQTVLGLFR